MDKDIITTTPNPPSPKLPLRRPRKGKVIGGVCAAIAHRYGLSPWGVRSAFILSCVLPGPQVLLYIALWALIPKESDYAPYP